MSRVLITKAVRGFVKGLLPIVIFTSLEVAAALVVPGPEAHQSVDPIDRLRGPSLARRTVSDDQELGASSPLRGNGPTANSPNADGSCDEAFERLRQLAERDVIAESWMGVANALTSAEKLVHCCGNPARRFYQLAELSRRSFEPGNAERLYLLARDMAATQSMRTAMETSAASIRGGGDAGLPLQYRLTNAVIWGVLRVDVQSEHGNLISACANSALRNVVLLLGAFFLCVGRAFVFRQRSSRIAEISCSLHQVLCPLAVFWLVLAGVPTVGAVACYFARLPLSLDASASMLQAPYWLCGLWLLARPAEISAKWKTLRARPTVWLLIIVVLVLGTVSLAIPMVTDYVLWGTGVSAGNRRYELAIIASIPIAALVEEYYFRRTVWARGRIAFGATLAAVMSTTLFALSHNQGLTRTVVLLALGEGLRQAFVRLGGLPAATACHWAANLLMTAIQRSGRSI